ncbi:hypothetical protein [Aureimonas psammosilenae]|uniref:hypothetical protein n=1 Tax=Aureimonas psammosilenae TaxID=2495496 RepID=UPI001260A0D3|nr:hypothetical protein [Aureimonas psammosilenae]
MTIALEFMAARAQLYARAQPHNAYLAYVRANGLALKSLADADPIRDYCGCMAVTTIRPLRDGGFEFAPVNDEKAVVAAVIEAYASDCETVSDLVAWPVADPTRVRRMFGRADCLGAWNIASAASYVLDSPLMAFRKPLGWLQAGCRGVVVLDPAIAARRLLDAAGKISGEDREHSQELGAMIAGLVERVQIVAPIQIEEREAA